MCTCLHGKLQVHIKQFKLRLPAVKVLTFLSMYMASSPNCWTWHTRRLRLEKLQRAESEIAAAQAAREWEGQNLQGIGLQNWGICRIFSNCWLPRRQKLLGSSVEQASSKQHGVIGCKSCRGMRWLGELEWSSTERSADSSGDHGGSPHVASSDTC